MPRLLIAEISNIHFGSLNTAKELIHTAKECGVHLVKGQAFIAEDIKTGSMPFEFYNQCQLHLEEYIELIYYARSIGIDMFYSVFSAEMEPLRKYENWHKYSGAQFKDIQLGKIINFDSDKCIISVPKGANLAKLNEFRRARLMYVSDYMATDPQLDNILVFKNHAERSIGYSDHTIGIDACKKAIEEYGANTIEKHFTIHKDLSFNGQIFRDSVFAADPKEIEQLARLIQ